MQHDPARVLAGKRRRPGCTRLEQLLCGTYPAENIGREVDFVFTSNQSRREQDNSSSSLQSAPTETAHVDTVQGLKAAESWPYLPRQRAH